MNRTKLSLLGILSVAAGLLAGCATKPAPMPPPAFTDQALSATDSAKTHVSSDVIQRFETFNGDFSSNNIETQTKVVYADNVYFRDPFKQMLGEPKLEAYLLRAAGAVQVYSMDWKDVAEHDGDYYFRWVMTVKFEQEGKKDPASLNNGMSHVRFDADGQVIFQQDYFDAGAFLYEKLPMMGHEIRCLKKDM